MLLSSLSCQFQSASERQEGHSDDESWRGKMSWDTTRNSELEPPLFRLAVKEKIWRFDGGESLGHGDDRDELQNTYWRWDEIIVAEKKELWRKKKRCGGKGEKCDDVKKRKEVLIISYFFNMFLGFKRVVPSKREKNTNFQKLWDHFSYTNNFS